MAKSKQKTYDAPADAPAAPKTPEEIRAEAEAKSAETAELRDALATAQNGFGRVAALVQGLGMGQLEKAAFQEEYDKALAEAQEAIETALGLLPDAADAEASGSA